jgi:DNA polymerase-1
MGATIANWWLIFIEDMLAEAGFEYGWDGDFVFCAWVHDEVQIACREEHAEEIKRICVEAAAEAGKYLEFELPVDASAVSGTTWMHTH